MVDAGPLAGCLGDVALRVRAELTPALVEAGLGEFVLIDRGWGVDGLPDVCGRSQHISSLFTREEASARHVPSLLLLVRGGVLLKLPYRIRALRASLRRRVLASRPFGETGGRQRRDLIARSRSDAARMTQRRSSTSCGGAVRRAREAHSHGADLAARAARPGLGGCSRPGPSPPRSPRRSSLAPG